MTHNLKRGPLTGAGDALAVEPELCRAVGRELQPGAPLRVQLEAVLQSFAARPVAQRCDVDVIAPQLLRGHRLRPTVD